MWLEVCTAVMGRKLSLWDTFLRPLLLTRAKASDDKVAGDTWEISCIGMCEMV